MGNPGAPPPPGTHTKPRSQARDIGESDLDPSPPSAIDEVRADQALEGRLVAETYEQLQAADEEYLRHWDKVLLRLASYQPSPFHFPWWYRAYLWLKRVPLVIDCAWSRLRCRNGAVCLYPRQLDRLTDNWARASATVTKTPQQPALLTTLGLFGPSHEPCLKQMAGEAVQALRSGPAEVGFGGKTYARVRQIGYSTIEADVPLSCEQLPYWRQAAYISQFYRTGKNGAVFGVSSATVESPINLAAAALLFTAQERVRFYEGLAARLEDTCPGY